MRATITMPLETLKAIIERAREYEVVDEGFEDDDFEDDDEDADDDSDLDADEDDDDDSSRLQVANDDEEDDLEDDDDLEADDEALEQVLEGLTSEELAELLALSWVGEGDFAPTEWNEAVGAAKALSTDDVIVQLAENPVLSDAIEKGLIALGYEISEDH